MTGSAKRGSVTKAGSPDRTDPPSAGARTRFDRPKARVHARSTNSADYQDVPRALALLSIEYQAGDQEKLHHHSRAQLVYATRGRMRVTTPDFTFIVPSQRAVWLPAGTDHAIEYRSATSLRTLYVRGDACVGMPTSVRVIEVSNLLRELIQDASHIPVLYDEDGREGRVMMLILDEIARTPVVPLCVPMPQNERLRAICEAMMNSPDRDDGLDSWADSAGMTRRTFTRAFRRETGMSFKAWCRDMRLLEALSRLADGERVTTVAFDVGYQSSSSFAVMFSRVFGDAPSRYVNTLSAE